MSKFKFKDCYVAKLIEDGIKRGVLSTEDEITEAKKAITEFEEEELAAYCAETELYPGQIPWFVEEIMEEKIVKTESAESTKTVSQMSLFSE